MKAAGREKPSATCLFALRRNLMISMIALQSFQSPAWPPSPSASSTTSSRSGCGCARPSTAARSRTRSAPSCAPRRRTAMRSRAAPARRERAARRGETHGAKRVLLIIGGGIAAYKSLDLIRRLHERGLAVRVVMTDGGAAVRHAARGRRAGRRARLHRPVRSAERIRRRPHPAGARGRADRGGAGDRRSDGADGARPRRRSRHRRAAGDRARAS